MDPSAAHHGMRRKAWYESPKTVAFPPTTRTGGTGFGALGSGAAIGHRHSPHAASGSSHGLKCKLLPTEAVALLPALVTSLSAFLTVGFAARLLPALVTSLPTLFTDLSIPLVDTSRLTLLAAFVTSLLAPFATLSASPVAALTSFVADLVAVLVASAAFAAVAFATPAAEELSSSPGILAASDTVQPPAAN